MSTLARYLLGRILPPFLLATLVILASLSLERLLRIVEDVTASGAPVGHAFRMLGYLVPHYLDLAVPAALFLAVLLGVRRLSASEELAAAQAAGVSLWYVLRPLLGLATIVAALLLVNTGYVKPHARYAFESGMHELTAASLTLRLQPGVFQRLGKGTMVRADEVSRGGQRLNGFFATVDRADGGRTVIAASRAVIREPASGSVLLELHGGTIVREKPGGETSSVDFDRYLWEPPGDTAAPYGPRGKTEQQLTLDELISGEATALARRTSPEEIRTEIHQRLVRPLSVPVVVLLAVPLALLGSGRTGQAYGFVVGIALLILYQKTLGFGESFSEAGRASPWLALWGPFALLCLGTGLMLWHRAEAAGQGLSVWLRRRLVRRAPGGSFGVPAE